MVCYCDDVFFFITTIGFSHNYNFEDHTYAYIVR